MRSLVIDFERRRLEERDIPEPSVTLPTQVLFRVQEVGVCGTDRELLTFRWPRPQRLAQFVIGHEALGQITDVGSSVEGFSRGDWVVPMIRRRCLPPCRSCARDRADLCLTGRYTERGISGAHGYYTEFAVDEARDLIRVPEHLIPYAILLEPLSVVEKAISRAQAIRQTDGDTALVLGLGPIGILSALVLQLRGYRVRLYSLEEPGHPRVRSLEAQGIEYITSLSGAADLILEAAGSGDLALSALGLLAPAGVFVTLGAQKAWGELSFINLIIGNHTIIGSVNASPDSFTAAVADLEKLPGPALDALIRRFHFDDYKQTLFGRPGPEPKYVHVMDSVGAGALPGLSK